MKNDLPALRIIRGCWQLASDHSNEAKNISPLLDSVSAGFTTFDCADIYLGVEALLGQAIKFCPDKNIRVYTKFVPDRSALHSLDFHYVEKVIDRSLQRLGVEKIDLVQFHWWDWDVKKYFVAMEALEKLKKAGKIAAIGLTNVNQAYLEEFAQRFNVYSVQSQVSLFDRRTERGLREFCHRRGIKIFAYGTLLGGFLSEQWLGKDEPILENLANRSLVKYKLLIDEACGWENFQHRLTLLKDMAHKYRSSIAAIVMSSLIQSKKADAVIVGLSAKNYRKHNQALINRPRLSTEDLQKLNAWSCELRGDPYDLERDKKGVHASIMKYDLNSQ